MTERGKFIVFEGIDGSGKSHHAPRLVQYLRSKGLDAVSTKEPGGIEETKPIRALILDPRLKDDGYAQIILFVADRRAHLLLHAVPALLSGKIVVSDRFSGSTIVYQHYDRGVPLDVATQLDRLARVDILGIDEVRPDLVILLDVEPRIGLARKLRGDEETNYFDHEVAKHELRRNAYLKLAQENNWEVIDTNAGKDEVFGKILIILREKGILAGEK